MVGEEQAVVMVLADLVDGEASMARSNSITTITTITASSILRTTVTISEHVVLLSQCEKQSLSP